MAFLLYLIAIASTLLNHVAAQQQNTFVSPCAQSNSADDLSRALVFHEGDEINLQWNTNIPSYAISLHQHKDVESTAENNHGPSIYTKTSNNNEESKFKWTVSVDSQFSLADSPTFSFHFLEAGKEGAGTEFSSCYFNITKKDLAPKNSKEVSEKLKIGLAVGLGLGIPACVLIALGIVVFLRYRTSKDAGDKDASSIRKASITSENLPELPQYTPTWNAPKEYIKEQQPPRYQPPADEDVWRCAIV